MKILITGADGMLGSNLARQLISQGHKVSGLIFPESQSSTLSGLDITCLPGNILDIASLEKAFAGQDVVVHAAASTAVWPSRSATVRRVNIDGTLNVIDAVLSQKVKRMIYIGSGSSVNTPGNGSKYKFPGAKYGLDYIDSKFEALNLVMDAAKQRGLPALAVLPTYMIGPYDSLPGSGKMILAIAKGKLKMYTAGGRNFVHVADVAAVIAASIEKGKIGEYYIAGGHNLTYREFFNIAAKVCKRSAPRIFVPCPIVKTFGLLGSIFGSITRTEPVLSYAMARISCDKQFIDPALYENELSTQRTDLHSMISDCHNWFVENNYLN